MRRRRSHLPGQSPRGKATTGAAEGAGVAHYPEQGTDKRVHAAPSS